MGATFDGPGEGWIEADDTIDGQPQVQFWDGSRWRSWMPKPDVPPLPTAPNTMIAAMLHNGEEHYLARNDPADRRQVRDVTWYNATVRFAEPDLLPLLKSWRLLAVPVEVQEGVERRIADLTASAIYAEVQPLLMRDPYDGWTAPRDNDENGYRRGFRSGLGAALTYIDAACRRDRTMDGTVAGIQREQANRVLDAVMEECAVGDVGGIAGVISRVRAIYGGAS
jgi:hypothetical protein